VSTMWERTGVGELVGNEEGDNGGGDGEDVVWSGANKGGCMHKVETVYKRVKKLFNKKGRDVEGCCRSIAIQMHLREEDVIVLMAGKSDRWYKELGFNTKCQI